MRFRTTTIVFFLFFAMQSCKHQDYSKILSKKQETGKTKQCTKPTKIIVRGEMHNLPSEIRATTKIRNDLYERNKRLINMDESDHFSLQGVRSRYDIGLEKPEPKELMAAIFLARYADSEQEDKNGAYWALYTTNRIKIKKGQLINRTELGIWQRVWNKLPLDFVESVNLLDLEDSYRGSEQAAVIIKEQYPAFLQYAKLLSNEIMQIEEISAFIKSVPELNNAIASRQWTQAWELGNKQREYFMKENILMALKTFAASTCKDFFVRIGAAHLEPVLDKVVYEIEKGVLHPLKIKVEASYSPEVKKLFSSSKYYNSTPRFLEP